MAEHEDRFRLTPLRIQFVTNSRPEEASTTAGSRIDVTDHIETACPTTSRKQDLWIPDPACGILVRMTEVTRILSEIEEGDPSAAEQLLPLVYEELRKLAAAKLANEKPGQTLQATALVHEAYMRLVDVEKAQQWDSRGHFFAAAAEAMRRILVNRARDKGRLKRGARRRRIDIDRIDMAQEASHEEILAISDAIDLLARDHQECADVAKMRFFVGFSLEETAAALRMSMRTAKRHSAYARAWLFRVLHSEDSR